MTSRPHSSRDLRVAIVRLGNCILGAFVGAAVVTGCGELLGVGGLTAAPEDAGSSWNDSGPDGTVRDSGSDVTSDGSVAPGPSGDSGLDSGPIPADSGPGDSACATSAEQCSGSQPQSCVDGVWLGNGAACSGDLPVCLEGACVECSPGSSRCDQTLIQACDPSGHWPEGGTCPVATPFCYDGSCSATAPSCAGGGAGRANCGLDGGESCCTSLPLEGGSYYRTFENFGGGPAGEADPAAITTFGLDKYEVTVGRFRSFVAAALPPDGGPGWVPPPGSGKHAHLNGGNGLANVASGGGFEPGWASAYDVAVAPTEDNLTTCASHNSGPNNNPSSATWTLVPSGNENLPINCVDWQEAYAFCIWDGGFLPSEAEWEYAAAGGNEQREYPWGSTAAGTGNQYAIYGCYYPSGTCAVPGGGAGNISPVGYAFLGAGRWGQLDLGGNLWEWSLDVSGVAYVDPCADCGNFGGTQRVARGGVYVNDATNLYTWYRDGIDPAARNLNIGIRCARSR